MASYLQSSQYNRPGMTYAPPKYTQAPRQSTAPKLEYTTPPMSRAPQDTPDKPPLAPIGNTGQVLGAQAPDFSQINQQTNDYLSLIDEEYNNSINRINSQEQSFRDQAGTATSQIENEYSDVISQLGRQQATAEEGVASQLSTAEKESKTATQQARDLYRHTQQKNIAELSGLGISSSSVSEAMAETLGVETARRISGITGSLSEIKQNASKELARIRDYTQNQTTIITREKANRIAEVNNNLATALRELESTRQESGTARQKNKLDLWYNAQNQIAQIQSDFEKYKQDMAKWSAQKADALIPLAQGAFNDIFNKEITNLQSQFTTTDFDITPSFSVDKYGQLTGNAYVTPKKKKEEEETTNEPTNTSFWTQ